MSSVVTTPSQRVRTAITKAAPIALWKNVSWTLLGSTVFSLSRWLFVVVVAKLANVEAVGEFTLAMAITTPIFLLSNLQLSAIQTVDTTDSFRFSDFLRIRAVTTALAFACTAVILSALDLSSSLVVISLLMAGAKCSDGLSDLTYGLFQKYEHFQHVAVSRVLRSSLSITFMAICMASTGSLAWGICGLFAGWAGVLLLYDIPIAIRLLQSNQDRPQLGLHTDQVLRDGKWYFQVRDHLNWEAWKGARDLIGPGIAMGIVSVLLSLSAYSPIYFTKLFADEKQLGLLAAVTCFHAAVGMLATSLGRAVSPRLATLHATGDRNGFVALLAKVCAITMVVGIVGVVGSMLFGKVALRLVFSPEYADHASTLIIVMIAALFMATYSSLGFAMTAAKQFRPQIPLVLVSTIIAAGASLCWIPQLGIAGAALAILARDIALFLLCLAFSWKIIHDMPKHDSSAAVAVASLSMERGS